jgi:subtilisin family serine protease
VCESPGCGKTSRTYQQLDAAPYETRANSAPEVMVKFKPGVSEEMVERITQGLNDRVEDEIEAVPGLDAIDDLDDASAESVAAQYRGLPEVEYAEAVFEISADEASPAPVTPHDPRFGEQWALLNDGSRGGTKGADISATMAWAVTTGSDKVVVAVLDSGVDYTHSDLAGNIWLRPDNVRPTRTNSLVRFRICMVTTQSRTARTPWMTTVTGRTVRHHRCGRRQRYRNCRC